MNVKAPYRKLPMGCAVLALLIAANALSLPISQGQEAAVKNAPALGLGWRTTSGGPLVIEEIDPQGPAAKAGLAKGDVLVAIDGKDVRTGDALAASLKKATPGQKLVVLLRRGAESISRTLVMPDNRVNMFGAVLQGNKGSRIQIEEVTPNTPAERAGLLKGDVVLSMAGQQPKDVADFTAFMGKLVANDKSAEPILLTVERPGKDEPLTLTIERVPAPAAVPGPAPPRAGGDVALAPRKPIVLGITVRQQGGRVVVMKMYERGPAAAAGVMAGDMILSLNKKAIDSHAALVAAAANVQPGEQVAVEIMRGDKSGVLAVVPIPDPGNATDIALDTLVPGEPQPASVADEVRALRNRVDALELLVNQLARQLGSASPAPAAQIPAPIPPRNGK